ncbi:hypothetical protein GCK72_022770 [Caenorhabditis remanei]|uniref:Uncharacterized protein n=1 Tax=Caenorhabditis remanei TaxID=31234 RepID=A0A6A5FUP9_CAERE|nr:hypothetical protein GCK72_022770 [Caenorhabditis remanei]KAF1746317.1 hypothetical protein GCK72_022770 [Caenorhabditis remanei]
MFQFFITLKYLQNSSPPRNYAKNRQARVFGSAASTSNHTDSLLRGDGENEEKNPVLQRQEAFDIDDKENEKEFDLCKEVERIEIGKEEEEKAEADEGDEDFGKV